LLGDFGWAISAHDPELEHDQECACGTPLWQGPEVPRHDEHGRSDVWAVGACIESLCRLDTGPVRMPPPNGVDADDWMSSPLARQPRGAGPLYSRQLNLALAAALRLDVSQRPDACVMLALLKRLHADARIGWEPLPERALLDVVDEDWDEEDLDEDGE
jgi:serine/threonine protein kinase